MNVPALRFKDDQGVDFPDWEEKSLGDISSIKRGASPRPIADKKWFTDTSKIGWVRISDVSKSSKFLVKTEQYLSDAGISKSRLVKQGNIIMSICATIGKPIYTSFDVCIHDGFVVFEDLQINHEYLYYYLILIEKKWYQYGQPGSQVNLNSDIVSNEIICIPCKVEQTKITTFLSAIDEKINHLTQKNELLEQYKKGVMQKIFSQEIRFKDDQGGEFPEWKDNKLEDIAKFLRGGALSKSEINISGKFECIHYGELFTKYAECIEIVISKTDKVGDVISEFGDILMPSSDVTPSGLAKASCLLRHGVIIGGDTNIVRVSDINDPVFISYLLNFEKRKIIELVSGTSVKHIYIKDIKWIELSIPCKSEQTKIADFMSEIDEKIFNIKLQLESTKQYKKGLLQQMFV